MTNEKNDVRTDRGAPVESVRRRPWSRPHLTRLRAGEAEIGANPATTEEAFAHGS
jgi:hypothetical protein